nr:unnamed protein product [Callosobruchus analis]
MKCSGLVGLLLLCLATVSTMPSDTVTSRYPGYNRFPLDSLSNFMHLNLTSSHILSGSPRGISKHNSVIKNNKSSLSKHKINKLKGNMIVKGTNSVNVIANASVDSNLKVVTMKPILIQLSTKHVTSKPHFGTTIKSSTIYKNLNKTMLTTDAPFRLKVTKPNEYLSGTSKVPTFIKVTTKTKESSTTVLPPSVTSKSTNKKKPTIHKVYTKWSGEPNYNEVKQNWYEQGVPYPNPNPEINSPSPSVSLSELSSVTPSLINQGDGLNPIEGALANDAFPSVSPSPEISSYSPQYSIADAVSSPAPVADSVGSAASDAGSSNPISVFNLDMVPDATRIGEGAGSPCPTVHISSSLFGIPQQRQSPDCSDLSLTINSHIHQNPGNTRNPSTYQAAGDPIAGPAEGAADPVSGGAEAADPASIGTAQDAPIGAAEDAPAASNPAANAGGIPGAQSGGSGGTGGSGGDGGDGDDGGGFKFPDLKGLFEALGYIWRALSHLLSFLRNPYLYIVPMALFFILGFIKVIALFPWWIPLLLFYVGLKSVKKPTPQIAVYKHVHKPVYHPDGWFWNHQTKTWVNVAEVPHYKKRVDEDVNSIEARIDKLLNGHQYSNSSKIPRNGVKEDPKNIEARIDKLLNRHHSSNSKAADPASIGTAQDARIGAAEDAPAASNPAANAGGIPGAQSGGSGGTGGSGVDRGDGDDGG